MRNAPAKHNGYRQVVDPGGSGGRGLPMDGSGDQAANGAPATLAQVAKVAGAVVGSRAVVTAKVEEIGDQVVDGQEALTPPG